MTVMTDLFVIARTCAREAGVQRVVQIGRGVNQRLEHEIGKRGGRRG